MTAQLRTDIWCAAFVRRHNDLGRVCVVARRGDPVAGQVFVEVDHLNGKVSLYVPAPTIAHRGPGRAFQRRFDRAEPALVVERIAREAEFDPDFWLIALETRDPDPGLDLVD